MNKTICMTALAVTLAGTGGMNTTLADEFGNDRNTFEIEFVHVGNPGNDPYYLDKPWDGDETAYPVGDVGYHYRIGKYEISEEMIEKANSEGSLAITTDDRGSKKPATSISWLEAARFVNWLNTSQGYPPAYNFEHQPGEDAYSIEDPASNWPEGGEEWQVDNPLRNRHAFYFIPTENEWLKAAYHIKLYGTIGLYWDYPTQQTDPSYPIHVTGGTGTYEAVYDIYDGHTNGRQPQPADIDYAGGLSAYGTMAQGGNVFEFVETSQFGDPEESCAYGGSSYMRFRKLHKDEGPIILGGRSSQREHVGFRVTSKSNIIALDPPDDEENVEFDVPAPKLEYTTVPSDSESFQEIAPNR